MCLPPVFAGARPWAARWPRRCSGMGWACLLGTALAATDLARVAEVIRRVGRGQSVAQIHPET
jgi:hypothetical protein